MIFENRKSAAKLLARMLKDSVKVKDMFVLAIPRGGLEIGEEVAKYLNAKLSIIVSKKIPHPFNPELVIGALGPEKTIALSKNFILEPAISKEYLESKIMELGLIIRERYRRYTGSEKLPSVKGQAVIVVDDGIATGQTMLAAVRYLRKAGAKRVIASAPVCSLNAKDMLSREAEVICLDYPEVFYAIGQFYREFPQLSDEDAIRILNRFWQKK